MIQLTHKTNLAIYGVFGALFAASLLLGSEFGFFTRLSVIVYRPYLMSVGIFSMLGIFYVRRFGGASIFALGIAVALNEAIWNVSYSVYCPSSLLAVLNTNPFFVPLMGIWSVFLIGGFAFARFRFKPGWSVIPYAALMGAHQALGDPIVQPYCPLGLSGLTIPANEWWEVAGQLLFVFMMYLCLWRKA